jgi:diguanylate cyclase (GGDEF)-like protein
MFGLFKPNVEELKNKGDIEGLAKALRYKWDKKVRVEAALALGEIRDKRAVKPLIQILESENKGSLIKAIEVLGRIKDEKAVEALIYALRSKSLEAQIKAAKALGEIRDKRAVEPLIQALRDKNEDLRLQAAKALGEIEEAKSVKPLIELLTDSDAAVRAQVAEALGKIGDKSSVEALLSALADKDWEVREKAALALGEIGDERAIESLIYAFTYEDAGTRLNAQSALIKIGERAVGPLIEALKYQNEEVRFQTAEALGEIGDKRGVEPLVQCLRDESWEVRRKATIALQKMGEMVEPLLDALEKERDEDTWSSRVSTFERLKELEKTAHVDTLTNVANRRLAEIKLSAKFNEMQRYGWTFGLLFIDIDHFKKINDVYGHDVGDETLKMVARIFMDNTRASDIVARWGGEEFIIIIPSVNKEKLCSVAEKLRLLVEKSRLKTDLGDIQVTISVGATLVHSSDTIESLVKRADELMYRSKISGRNRITVR